MGPAPRARRSGAPAHSLRHPGETRFRALAPLHRYGENTTFRRACAGPASSTNEAEEPEQRVMEVPGYQIKRTIGQGGMATVYLAIQESLDRAICLKVLGTQQTDRERFVQRFLNEGRMIASLRHPNIITIFDIGVAGENVFIAMEYVEGGDLKTRLTRAILPDQALSIVYKIAAALECAHAKGIVHRDVKPANILFRDVDTPVLTDFGIAKQLSSTDGELTSTGTILGSPYYMSPEQSEGRPVDQRSDIYSLGIIAYEMLTGERPYNGESAIKVIMQHIQSPIPRLPEHQQRFQPLIDDMLAKDREKRIPDARTLRERVRELRNVERSGTFPVLTLGGAAQRAPRLRLRTRLAILFVSMLALGVGFGAFFAWAQSLSVSTVVQPRVLPRQDLTASAARLPLHTVSNQPGTDGATSPKLRADATRALEWLALRALEEGRLIQPPADNAYYYYSRLLALDPKSKVAARGFTRIADRFVALAERQFAKGRYAKAEIYIALGLQIQPTNRGLHELQALIAKRPISLWQRLTTALRRLFS